MFLTSDQNRLPFGAALTGSGGALWALVEMWSGADVLILQIAATKRSLPRVAMVELSSGAVTLEQLTLEGGVVKGAAVLSAKPQHESAQWSLDALSEIHLGATRAFDDEHPLVAFARYTMIDGQELSLPMHVAERASRGKCIYRIKPASPQKVVQRPRSVTAKTELSRHEQSETKKGERSQPSTV